MSNKCLNINDPAARKYIADYGEYATAAIFELHEKLYPQVEMSDVLAGHLFQILRENEVVIKEAILSKYASDVEDLTKYFEEEVESRDKIKNLIEKSFNWAEITERASQLESEQPLYKKADLSLEKIRSTEEAKTLAEGIITYFADVSKYLGVIKDNTTEILGDKEIDLKEKFVQLYKAAQVARSFAAGIKQWREFVFPQEIPGSNVLKNAISTIEADAETVIKNYKTHAAYAIASEISNELLPHTKSISEQNQKEIDYMSSEVEKLEEKQRNQFLDSRARDIKFLKSKINKRESFQKTFATQDNLQRALTSPFENDNADEDVRDISIFSVALESAALSSNLITGSIGTYIYRTITKGEKSGQAFEAKMAKLAEKMAQEHSGRIYGEFSIDEFMKPYVRKVKTAYINANGELTQMEEWALNSEMDESGYQFEKTLLNHTILQKRKESKTNPLAVDEVKSLERKLRKLIRDNEHTGLTEEAYQIEDALSEDAREARQEIISQMRELQSQGVSDSFSDAVLNQVESLRFQLDRLESLVNLDNTPKTGKDLEIAQSIKDWKDKTRAAELHRYVMTDEKLDAFRERLQEWKDNIKEAENEVEKTKALYEQNKASTAAVRIAEDELKKINKQFTTWSRVNTKRQIDPNFYTLRKSLLDDLGAIQEKYRVAYEDNRGALRLDLEIWDDIFNLLKGYRDQDGVYRGSEVTTDIKVRIKELQKELESNKELFKKLKKEFAKIDPEQYQADQEALTALYEQLRDLQETVQTPAYLQAVERQKAKIRSKLVVNKALNDTKFNSLRESALLNAEKRIEASGAYTRMEVEQMAIREVNLELYLEMKRINPVLESQVQDALEQSDWWKINHIDVWRYNPITETGEFIQEPLYFWNIVEPTDKIFIDTEAPSFKWTTFEYNPEFIDQNYKYIPGRAQLRRTSTFKNESYNSLSEAKKQLLSELTDLYSSAQKGLPNSLKRGLILPSMRTHLFTSLKDNLDPRKWGGRIQNFVDSMKGEDEEEEGTSSGQTASGKYQRRLFLNYARRVDASQTSNNALASIALFGNDAERFKEVFKNSPYLFGVQDIMEDKFNNTNIKSMIDNTMDKLLFGQQSKTIAKSHTDFAKLERFIAKQSDSSLKISSTLALSYRVPSAIKNFLANLHNVLINNPDFDFSINDLLKGMGEGAAHIGEFFMAEIQGGQESDYVRMFKHFYVAPNHSTARNVIKNDTRTVKHFVNPLNYLSFFRSFLEIETRLAVFKALQSKFIVQDLEGNDHYLMDAYHVVDGVVTIKENFDKAQVQIVEMEFQGRLHSVDALINGAYHKMDAPEVRRYFLGRLLMYMRGWLTYQTARRFGGTRLAYGGGFEYEGLYRAVILQTWDFLRNYKTSMFNFSAYQSTISKSRRAALRGAMYDSTVVAALMSLVLISSGAVYGDSDDDDQQGTYFGAYNAAYILDEIETLHPIFGPYSIIYSRWNEKNTQVNGFQYYVSKNLLLPYQGAYSVFEAAWDYTVGDINPFDKYYPRNKSGEIVTKKGVPINPALKDKSEITARFLRLSGLASSMNYTNTFGGQPDYSFNTFEHYNPKPYIKSLKEDLQHANKNISHLQSEMKGYKKMLKDDMSEERREEIYNSILENKNQIKKLKFNRREMRSMWEDNTIE